MAILTTATGLVSAGGSALGFDPVQELSGLVTGLFSNQRGSKRERRDQLLEALYGVGVSRNALSGVHSDHVADLEEIINWVQQEGQPAIQYLNETKPAGTGSAWDDKIIQGYSRWKQGQPASQPTPQPAGQQTAGGQQLQQAGMSNNTIILIASAIAGFLIFRG